jgi:hypothetical protein
MGRDKFTVLVIDRERPLTSATSANQAIGIRPIAEGDRIPAPGRQFYRATMRVANTTDVSGRVTADSIKDGL